MTLVKANWLDAETSSGQLVDYGNGTSDAVIQFIRLKLDTLTGGSSPTVSASVVAT